MSCDYNNNNNNNESPVAELVQETLVFVVLGGIDKQT